MVAAWMSALEGVGPSIAFASQVPRGSCADLPIAPHSNSRQMLVSTPGDIESTAAKTSSNRRLPVWTTRRNMATSRAASPTLFMTNALVPACAATERSR